MESLVRDFYTYSRNDVKKKNGGVSVAREVSGEIST